MNNPEVSSSGLVVVRSQIGFSMYIYAGQESIKDFDGEKVGGT